ncbi:MAG: hypothetical protein P0107_05290 [Nitrosomonas sp.]|nr:hypothetical protein [Nitrosomonas sp.]
MSRDQARYGKVDTAAASVRGSHEVVFAVIAATLRHWFAYLHRSFSWMVSSANFSNRPHHLRVDFLPL